MCNMLIFRGVVKMGIFLLNTPPKSNIEPENDGTGKMIFLFQECILRFQPLIFRGVGMNIMFETTS